MQYNNLQNVSFMPDDDPVWPKHVAEYIIYAYFPYFEKEKVGL
jgi:hypothetical protein